MKTKLATFGFFVLLCTILLSSCADREIVAECLKGSTYGFWYGLWHGIIAPISFIASIFYDGVAVYAINNNGTGYDFGFLIGVGGFGWICGR